MNLKPRRHEEPEINMVSLIDVVLMLVIFFMLSSSFVGEGRLRVHLPQASSVPIVRAVEVPLVVTVRSMPAQILCAGRSSRRPRRGATSR